MFFVMRCACQGRIALLLLQVELWVCRMRAIWKRDQCIHNNRVYHLVTCQLQQRHQHHVAVHHAAVHHASMVDVGHHTQLESSISIRVTHSTAYETVERRTELLHCCTVDTDLSLLHVYTLCDSRTRYNLHPVKPWACTHLEAEVLFWGVSPT